MIGEELTITPDEFLEHFGVKGMKWGKTTSKSSSKEETSPDHSDAVTAKVNGQKAKTGGTSKLSNKELQEVVTRMNLEQQYTRLNPSKVSKGHAKVKAALGVIGTVSSIIALNNSPIGQAVKSKLK